MDRKFTSLATTAELFEKKLTVVGTIASTRTDVPLELRPQSLNKSLPGTIRFAFRDKETYKGLNKSYAAILRIFGYNCQQGEAITRDSVIKEPEGPATRAAIKKLPKKGRCFVCPRSEDRKYMKICNQYTVKQQHVKEYKAGTYE
ncbi:hypothetical protein ILUMI_04258 [Ignelater luminosus]|uniref:PiggyBac transposable element-derived protein domain-containing protein n=1 Tax=Ignelater luminosus TaxID=2038154 RepID=A0A8K0DF28_IGNLU|nr:hypothetical protein ILUMI_04258 [Ignelater luminosus]